MLPSSKNARISSARSGGVAGAVGSRLADVEAGESTAAAGSDVISRESVGALETGAEQADRKSTHPRVAIAPPQDWEIKGNRGRMTVNCEGWDALWVKESQSR